ncbi:SPIN family peroxidase inhibitor [Staphylococcus agnetis]|uniref:SPIN family peroxidase inhibitor n=1 Tax=Staphylococcus agnetis TaxID=985762 RepID=A0ABD7TT24_9STAP|nr:SPIN family peroxidase inhibitor [Staphylococcus agnetis]MCO4339999.1 SPIN family peroxidase inhibitor [Staphylococcus agnetis]MCO4342235.1 SPIN family peroxidase inhibitor [Staphylococcus agnetis]MCO4346964.1 SPIN family peroxidase inhibitor [Staphylococcus agnetis]MCO4352575.1 SPIN family peroxidase inhibitor [Staphylococcus agnetis]MCO4365986.1 SPIN family peroxidase inhibitor [Staphylococcus agnetis]
MNINKVILSAVTTGVLATGIFAAVPHQQADAAVHSKGGIVLHDDSRILEHELDYVGILLDRKADKKTKAGIRAYFKLLGYKSVKDFVKTAKAQGLDTSKYDYLLKK